MTIKDSYSQHRTVTVSKGQLQKGQLLTVQDIYRWYRTVTDSTGSLQTVQDSYSQYRTETRETINRDKTNSTRSRRTEYNKGGESNHTSPGYDNIDVKSS